MPSQVSGGFWLQVPNDYHAKYKYSHPTKIILECECTRHEQSFIYRVSYHLSPLNMMSCLLLWRRAACTVVECDRFGELLLRDDNSTEN